MRAENPWKAIQKYSESWDILHYKNEQFVSINPSWKSQVNPQVSEVLGAPLLCITNLRLIIQQISHIQAFINCNELISPSRFQHADSSNPCGLEVSEICSLWDLSLQNDAKMMVIWWMTYYLSGSGFHVNIFKLVNAIGILQAWWAITMMLKHTPSELEGYVYFHLDMIG